MKLKLDAEGRAVLQDGLPVYVHDDGKEIPFDAAATIGSLNSRIEQNKRVEAENKALKDATKAYEGLDPAAARRALELIDGLDETQLADVKRLDEIRASAAKARDEAVAAIKKEYEPVISERDRAIQELHSEKIKNAFANSKVIAQKLTLPAEPVQRIFGSNFAFEEGRIVAKDHAGNAIYSRAKPGELADFDEAIDILVDSYPHRDTILKGSGGNGAGTRGNGAAGGGKTLSRAEFDRLPPADRMARISEGFQIVA
jgi:ribosomal 50S subunit-associated protein YjgA (DUF615 family)